MCDLLLLMGPGTRYETAEGNGMWEMVNDVYEVFLRVEKTLRMVPTMRAEEQRQLREISRQHGAVSCPAPSEQYHRDMRTAVRKYNHKYDSRWEKHNAQWFQAAMSGDLVGMLRMMLNNMGTRIMLREAMRPVHGRLTMKECFEGHGEEEVKRILEYIPESLKKLRQQLEFRSKILLRVACSTQFSISFASPDTSSATKVHLPPPLRRGRDETSVNDAALPAISGRYADTWHATLGTREHA
eukprot:COSAG04_NODE_7403_length_1134_cov_1.664734_1_plen_241_part_00